MTDTDLIREMAEALDNMHRVIESAGLGNLADGVQVGRIAWFVTATDAMDISATALTAARERLAREDAQPEAVSAQGAGSGDPIAWRPGYRPVFAAQPAPEPAEPATPQPNRFDYLKLIRADFEDRMRAHGENEGALARLVGHGEYVSPRVQQAWESEKRKYAAPPAKKPLTEERIVMDGLMMLPTADAADCAKAFTAGVRFAERAHGITAPSAAEGGANAGGNRLAPTQEER